VSDGQARTDQVTEQQLWVVVAHAERIAQQAEHGVAHGRHEGWGHAALRERDAQHARLAGERGVELVLPNESAGEVWDALVEGGAERCGLAARDTLRLEMGYPLHGNELSTDINPYEARSGWAVKLEAGPFVGRDALAAVKAEGPARRLWGLVGDGRRPPRAGMAVSVDGSAVGVVTSGSFSPVRGVGIGLALLDGAVEDGAVATVDVRGTDVAFTVARPPLVDSNPR
jgi:aminomethyltransferase